MVTHERLTEVLDYDPLSGVFKWKQAVGKRVRVGDVAGSTVDGYIRIVLDKVKYRAHRLAWFYVNKVWPSGLLDHKDTNRSNNRIDNLRLATKSENNHNRRLNTNSTTGVKGVTYHKQSGKYVTLVQFKSVQYRFGSHDTIEAAEIAVRRGRETLHGDFVNHGVD